MLWMFNVGAVSELQDTWINTPTFHQHGTHLSCTLVSPWEILQHIAMLEVSYTTNAVVDETEQLISISDQLHYCRLPAAWLSFHLHWSSTQKFAMFALLPAFPSTNSNSTESWHWYIKVFFFPPTLFLFSLSQCTGVTSISEDSSEISFLLVENYNYLTASVGLRIGWEFLINYYHILFIMTGALSPVSGEERLSATT